MDKKPWDAFFLLFFLSHLLLIEQLPTIQNLPPNLHTPLILLRGSLRRTFTLTITLHQTRRTILTPDLLKLNDHIAPTKPITTPRDIEMMSVTVLIG